MNLKINIEHTQFVFTNKHLYFKIVQMNISNILFSYEIN